MAHKVRDKAGLPKDFRPLHVRHVYASMLISSARLTFTAFKGCSRTKARPWLQYSPLRDEALRKAASVIDTCMDISAVGTKLKIHPLTTY